MCDLHRSDLMNGALLALLRFVYMLRINPPLESFPQQSSSYAALRSSERETLLTRHHAPGGLVVEGGRAKVRDGSTALDPGRGGGSRAHGGRRRSGGHCGAGEHHLRFFC